jgi:polar amino acid transport system substrate-binding protein
MKRTLAILIALTLLAGLAFGCSSGLPKSTKDTSTLVVGMELAYPPFETKDDQGDPYGVSVNFANALGVYLGRPVRIENLAWDGLIPALQTGQIDLVISSMTITDARKAQIDFSIPYAKALLALLVNKGSGVASATDLNASGRKIAVKIGSTGEIVAGKDFPNATLIPLADESACVTEVVQGKADAFIYDQLTITRNNAKYPDQTTAVYLPGQTPEYWGVGVKKGRDDLLAQVDDFIRAFYNRDGFTNLTEIYLKDEKAMFDRYGFPWFFDDVIAK